MFYWKLNNLTSQYKVRKNTTKFPKFMYEFFLLIFLLVIGFMYEFFLLIFLLVIGFMYDESYIYSQCC